MATQRSGKGRRASVLATVVGAALLSGKTQGEGQRPVDTDHDGLSDALEQQLLQQFLPKFMVGAHDCSVQPAEFRPDVKTPEVEAENGTIYGQVSLPAKQDAEHGTLAEIHYYHLWRKDCGGHGHPLDTEHVAVQVRASGQGLESATWKATYWYAAAHEDTVCDVSQVARAATLHAEEYGATVWISPGKHASYLNETLCDQGCGADRCVAMVPLRTAAVINLGEPGRPMNGSLFVASSAWPLGAKMASSNFPAAPIERLEQLPVTDIAWFHPGRHPAQGIIAHSSSTEQALATSGSETVSAISVAGDSTQGALSGASDSTANALSNAGSSTESALGKSYGHTRHALGTTARHVGDALHMTHKAEAPQEPK